MVMRKEDCCAGSVILRRFGGVTGRLSNGWQTDWWKLYRSDPAYRAGRVRSATGSNAGRVALRQGATKQISGGAKCAAAIEWGSGRKMRIGGGGPEVVTIP